MNADLFSQVERLAEALLSAADQDDETLFYQLYEQLSSLCELHAGKKSDHPLFLETLADFTEDSVDAVALYQRAFLIADSLKENEYKASIQFSLAQRLAELGEMDQAKDALATSEKFASFTDDDELKGEISALAGTLN
ncbi:tetratricopeptide repeat protein [Neptuniibacter pectenicola]|uniref:tetratricopeptide repeat protein n=1 Tax=Neptuniibacter pectenicola TaxID=1806669 RepID=UPI0030EF01D3